MRDPFGVLAFLHWSHDWNDFHFDEETRRRAIHQLRDIGLRFVRTDILWADVHRGPGRYDFSSYDRWIPSLRENGLEPLVLLHYNKEKVSPSGEELWNRPPESFEEFAAYVHAAVSRFKPHVRHWEIWNEPNHPLYWTGPKDGLAAYTRLLSLSRAAAKAADPACLVINGGITGAVFDDVASFYSNGGGPLTDILNIHTFLDPHDAAAEAKFDAIVTGVRRVMDAQGDEAKKIWITEMGCPGIPDGRPNQSWFSGQAMTEAEQAEWLDKQYDWVERYPSVEKLFWAFYRDTDGIFKDATDHFGLVRHDLSPKPSFERLAGRIRRHRSQIPDEK